MRYIVYFVNFLFSFAGAVTLYSNSSFIGGIVGIQWVGILYTLGAILCIWVLTRAGKILARGGNRTFFLGYGALYSLSLALLILPTGSVLRILGFVLYLFSTNVLAFSINVFFHHLAPLRKRGKARGFFLLLGNIGIMLGPVIATHVIDLSGYLGTYALDIAVFALIAVIVELCFARYKDAEYHFGHIETAVRHTFRDTRLRNVISANFILQFFYAWMIVYTPIYLSQYLGYSWDSIGIIFSIMLLAFVILDYPLGRLADWLGSEKELAALGFLLMAGCVFTLAFVPIKSVAAMGVLLFCSRVGAATVEAMTEIHFFKIAKDSDPGLLSLFCDIRPLSYVIAPLLGVIALAFLPFKMMFAVLGVILILGFFIALHLERKDAWWVRAHKE